jgi:hypothetical protein
MHTSRLGKAEDWKEILGAVFCGCEAGWICDLLVPNAGFTRVCGGADVRLAMCELDGESFFERLRELLSTFEEIVREC